MRLWTPIVLAMILMATGCSSVEGIKISTDEWFPEHEADANGFRFYCDEGEAIIEYDQEGESLKIRRITIEKPNGEFRAVGDGSVGKVVIMTADKTILRIDGSIGVVVLDSVDHNRVNIRGDGIVLLRGSSSWSVVEDTSYPEGYTQGISDIEGPKKFKGEKNIFKSFGLVGGGSTVPSVLKEYGIE
jgi:hypothetical protein